MTAKKKPKQTLARLKRETASLHWQMEELRSHHEDTKRELSNAANLAGHRAYLLQTSKSELIATRRLLESISDENRVYYNETPYQLVCRAFDKVCASVKDFLVGAFTLPY